MTNEVKRYEVDEVRLRFIPDESPMEGMLERRVPGARAVHGAPVPIQAAVAKEVRERGG